MNQLDEARKWLMHGYETYGLEGARVMAKAMGLQPGPSHATLGNGEVLTATSGSDTIQTDDQSQIPIHRGPPRPAPRRAPNPPAPCPPHPPRGAQGWQSYNETGNPDWFHCGYEGYLEDREPSPEHPVAECFYDERGRLVDEGHAYAGCKGTPNSYPATDVWDHAVNDPGGIRKQGIPAAWESFRHARDQANRRVRDAMKRNGYPPYSIGPFRAPLPR